MSLLYSYTPHCPPYDDFPGFCPGNGSRKICPLSPSLCPDLGSQIWKSLVCSFLGESSNWRPLQLACEVCSCACNSISALLGFQGTFPFLVRPVNPLLWWTANRSGSPRVDLVLICFERPCFALNPHGLVDLLVWLNFEPAKSLLTQILNKLSDLSISQYLHMDLMKYYYWPLDNFWLHLSIYLWINKLIPTETPFYSLHVNICLVCHFENCWCLHVESISLWTWKFHDSTGSMYNQENSNKLSMEEKEDGNPQALMSLSNLVSYYFKYIPYINTSQSVISLNN